MPELLSTLRQTSSNMQLKPFTIAALLIGMGSALSGAEQGAQEAKPDKLDLTKTASYESGPWGYRYIVLEEGPHKGYVQGFLSYGGKELLDPKDANAFVSTPWGWLQWTPRSLSGRGNWLPVKDKPTKGRELPEPAKHPELISNPPPPPKRP